MSALHTINKSPFEKNSLESCLSCAEKGSAILLIEDGVYGAIEGSSVAEMVKQATGDFAVYALEPDVKTRGISHKVLGGVKLVNYAGFVELAAQNDKVIAWL